MSDTYTKLFSSITESTVWGESYATRIVWVTLLAMADAHGNVYGSVPGLARRANVTLQEAQGALEAFMSPDPYSRTKDDEGRRVSKIEGGWNLTTHAKYSAVRNSEERREYKREWDRKNRSKAANESDISDTNPTKQTVTTPPTPTPTPTQEKQDQKIAPKGDLLNGIDPEIAADFKALRAKLRAPITATAMKGIQREADKAGVTLQDALRICCENSWRGFKADWFENISRKSNGTVQRRESVAERSERIGNEHIERFCREEAEERGDGQVLAAHGRDLRA